MKQKYCLINSQTKSIEKYESTAEDKETILVEITDSLEKLFSQYEPKTTYNVSTNDDFDSSWIDSSFSYEILSLTPEELKTFLTKNIGEITFLSTQHFLNNLKQEFEEQNQNNFFGSKKLNNKEKNILAISGATIYYLNKEILTQNNSKNNNKKSKTK